MLALPCFAGPTHAWGGRRRVAAPTSSQCAQQLHPRPCRQQQSHRPRSSSDLAQTLSDDDDELGPSHEEYMQEYAQYKQKLLDSTRKSGSLIGLYFLLAVNGQAAACCMLGTAFSYAYVMLLCRDIDAVRGTDKVPHWEAEKIDNPLLRGGAKLVAAYRQALKPRLLVPAALAALLGAYNALAEEPLPLVYSGCALGGFLSYKIALLTEVFQQNAIKASSAEEDDRPVVERFEDELDVYGRPKRQLTSPAAVLPEEQQAKVAAQLAEEEAKQQRRQQQQQQRRG